MDNFLFRIVEEIVHLLACIMENLVALPEIPASTADRIHILGHPAPVLTSGGGEIAAGRAEMVP